MKVVLSVVLLGVSLVLAGCGGATPAAPTERTVYMAAVEPKGGASVDSEPFPTGALPEGPGYALKEPNAEGRWEVETYRWDPGTVVVIQGDVVTLEIIGINGKEHPVRIEGYPDVTGVVRRGQVTRLTFTANQAGIFKIICDTHPPSMQADLVVLSP